MSLQVYKSTSLQVYESTSLWVYEFTKEWGFLFLGFGWEGLNKTGDACRYFFQLWLECESIVCRTIAQIFTQIKHTSHFTATAFGYIQVIDKFCVRTRFRAFGYIIHNRNRSSLYLIFKTPILTWGHHLINSINQSSSLLPYIEILNTPLLPHWLSDSNTRWL